MEPWVWLIVYLVGFALLQLVLYRYVRNRDSSSEQPTGSPGARSAAGRERRTESATEVRIGSEPDGSGDADRVRCTHCGALNEQGATFRYCRECTQPIQ